MLEPNPLLCISIPLIMKLEPDIDPVVLQVIDAAALLDTTEFDIFSLAYTHWFGEKASLEIIEFHFKAYMFREIVPFWVRHFTRHIMRLYATEHLNPCDYGLNRPPASKRMVFIGRFYIFLLILILVVLLAITTGSEQVLSFAKNCYFPPCY